MRVNSILRLGFPNFVTFFLRISFILSGGAFFRPSLRAPGLLLSATPPFPTLSGKMGGKLGSYRELCSIDLLDVLRSPRPQGAGRPWLPGGTPADRGGSVRFYRSPVRGHLPRPTGGLLPDASICNAKVFLLKLWPERNVCPRKAGFTPSLPEWTDRRRNPISTVSIRDLPGVKPPDLLDAAEVFLSPFDSICFLLTALSTIQRAN